MYFICLGYLDAAGMDACPKEEIDAVMDKCGPHLMQFYESGRVRMDAGLGAEAVSLRRINSEVRAEELSSIAERERLGSVFLIEAEDLEEAVRVASLHPAVQVGEGERFGWRLEIRPVHQLERRL